MDEDFTEQYSVVSAQRLRLASDQLMTAVQQYVHDAVEMRGGSSELGALFERNESLAAVVRAFNEAALDHTGTSPLLLDTTYDDDDEDEDEPEDDSDDYISVGVVSVVSRWDLAVLSTEDLLEAGRAAHRSGRPEETDEDAAVAVSDEGSALYAILHERGEPWFTIPGVDVVAGARAFIEPAAPLEPYDGDPDTLLNALRAPDGRTVYGESW